MQGFNIELEDADFSANNLGNIFPLKAATTLAGITDPDTIYALNNMYHKLVDAGLWAKLDMIMPFVGGTAQAHKVNFKNPVNTDAAFRLSFFNDNPAAHTSAGYIPNGIDRYAETFYKIPNLASFHISIYNVTEEDLTTSRAFAGTGSPGASPHIIVLGRNYGNRTASNIGSTAANVLQAAIGYDTNKTGLLLANRTTLTSQRLFDNKIIIASGGGTAVDEPTSKNSILIGGYRSTAGAPQLLSKATIGFMTAGPGLSVAEIEKLTDIINEFQLLVR